MEWVVWVLFGWVQCLTLVGVELSGELIAVNNSEDSAINVQVHAKIQLFPAVVFCGGTRQGHFVAFQKYTLGDSAVLNSVLDDVDGVIVEVVENCALSDTIVLIRVFNYWLLEIGHELEDLYLNLRLKKYKYIK